MQANIDERDRQEAEERGRLVRELLLLNCDYLDPTRCTLNWSPRGQVTLFFFLQ